MTNVGYATLSVIPSLRGFQSAVNRGTSAPMATAGRNAGRGFSSAFTRSLRLGAGIGGIGAVFGVASFIKDSVELEARYSKTMAQMRVATKAPADELRRLDDLAIQLGKETVFSAVDASDAMLELAKNGIKPATIEAGALESALTLAAAGSTDLSSAASTMGNTLNAFRLKGKDSASVAAALAGAANASSASVGSLAEGLQQASTVAADTGFNVQETTGILAAFANAGIAGSDAGTSLKTMLTRLIPTTNKAAKAQRKYGLEFVKGNGEFKGALGIAKELEDGLGKLSDSERSAALNTIFGSDARRAATILVKEGADGLAKYIKATSDQGAAEEMAQANMEGTAGAIERLKGAWETAKLEFGKEIAPVAADFLDYLSDNIDDLAPKLVDFGEWFADDGVKKIKQFKNFVEDDVVPVLKDIGDFASDAAGFVGDIAEQFNKMPSWAKKALIGGTLATVATNKVLPGGVPSLARSITSKAIPVRVFETNPLALGGGGGGTGGVIPGGGKGGLLSGAAKITLVGAAAVYLGNEYLKYVTNDPNKGYTLSSSKDATDPNSAYADPRRRLGSEELATYLDAMEKKAQGLGTTLDLVGSKKVEPLFAVPGLAEGRAGLQEFLRLQINAGKPITPYVDTTSIERAIAMARKLDAALPGNVNVNAGTDGGANYVSGGAGGSNGRATFDNVTIVAHDYNDFLTQAQRRTQQAGLGGF